MLDAACHPKAQPWNTSCISYHCMHLGLTTDALAQVIKRGSELVRQPQLCPFLAQPWD